MKKLTSTLGVFAAAAGIAAAFAMSPAPTKAAAKSSDALTEWFRYSDGTYLGSDTQANKQAACGSGTINCVMGYEAIDEEENPIGTGTPLQGNKQL